MKQNLDFTSIIPILAYKNHRPAKLKEFSIKEINNIFGTKLNKKEENKLYEILAYFYNYKLNDGYEGFGVVFLVDDGHIPTVEFQRFTKEEKDIAIIYLQSMKVIFEFPNKEIDILVFDGKPRREKEIEKILKNWKENKDESGNKI